MLNTQYSINTFNVSFKILKKNIKHMLLEMSFRLKEIYESNIFITLLKIKLYIYVPDLFIFH